MGVSPIALAAFVSPVLGAIDPASHWLTYIVGGGGLVGILALIVTTGRDLINGRLKANDQREASLALQRDTAWKERDEAIKRERAADRRADVADQRADCEARNNRKLWVYATRLKRQLILLSVEPAVPEPDLDDCDFPQSRP